MGVIDAYMIDERWIERAKSDSQRRQKSRPTSPTSSRVEFSTAVAVAARSFGFAARVRFISHDRQIEVKSSLIPRKLLLTRSGLGRLPKTDQAAGLFAIGIRHLGLHAVSPVMTYSARGTTKVGRLTWQSAFISFDGRWTKKLGPRLKPESERGGKIPLRFSGSDQGVANIPLFLLRRSPLSPSPFFLLANDFGVF